jgi:hypothetical protein
MRQGEAMTDSASEPVRGGADSRRTSADELDVPLEDPEQMEEVELLSSLMIQAGSADAPLDQAEVDRLLGIDDPSG